MSDEEINLIAFNSIYKFIKSLGDLYSSVYKPLALYNRLISKTTISHTKAVKKHVACFRQFCISNRDSISNKNHKDLNGLISYSNNVYIDMSVIFDIISKEEDSTQIRETVWKHLLTISALLDPAGKAKEILKESSKRQNSKNNNSGKEVEFISNIIDKVEKNVDPNANPMEAISSIISSGVITDLITSMNNDLQNGELDISKLMGAVSGMVSTLGNNNDNNDSNENNFTNQDNSKEAMNMLQTMMGSFMGGMMKNDRVKTTENLSLDYSNDNDNE